MPKKFNVDESAKAADLGEGTSFASHSNVGEPLMASFLGRFIAYAIDSIILYIILILISGLLFLGVSFFLISYGPDIFKDLLDPMFTVLIIFVIILDIFLALFYFVYFYKTTGQTPGKMVMNIKVVDRNTLGNLTIGKIIIRESIGRLISLAFCFLGYFWYFYSEQRQTWHDSLVNSVVVSLNDEGDINMKGQDSYPKDAVKAFLPPMLLFITMLMISLMFILIVDFLLQAGIFYELWTLPYKMPLRNGLNGIY